MTLKEWKNRLTPGTRLFHVSSTIRGKVNEFYTVSIAQTNGVYLTPDTPRPDKKDLWMNFPKAAANLNAHEEGFTITYGTAGESVYRWVN